MSTLSFSKYEGLGNDFIVIDDRLENFPLADRSYVQKLCHRKFGIGADGILLLQNDREAHFRMRILNSDGSEAESCGNGLRCLIKFLRDLSLPLQKYRIRTADRIVVGFLEGENGAIDMGVPENFRLHLKTDLGEIHYVDSGVPHAVQFCLDVKKVDLLSIAPVLRRHSLFQPKGANINFAEVKGDGSVQVRTFERGVEGETLACGTGAVAVMAIVNKIYPARASRRIFFPGGDLEIREEEGHFWMIGPANLVFRGSLIVI